jgi:hypothetical protein
MGVNLALSSCAAEAATPTSFNVGTLAPTACNNLLRFQPAFESIEPPLPGFWIQYQTIHTLWGGVCGVGHRLPWPAKGGVEIYTHQINRLTETDFFLAAKSS